MSSVSVCTCVRVNNSSTLVKAPSEIRLTNWLCTCVHLRQPLIQRSVASIGSAVRSKEKREPSGDRRTSEHFRRLCVTRPGKSLFRKCETPNRIRIPHCSTTESESVLSSCECVCVCLCASVSLCLCVCVSLCLSVSVSLCLCAFAFVRVPMYLGL